MGEQQQRARQSQAQGGQSQAQAGSQPRSLPDPASGSPSERQPIDPDLQQAQASQAPSGERQQGLNQPSNMQQRAPEEEAVLRRQAGMQERAGGFGHSADGETEMANPPDASEHGAEPEAGGEEQSMRGYGGREQAQGAG